MLECNTFHKTVITDGFQSMLMYHMQEVHDPALPLYSVSVSSIRKIQHDATYVWKASRKSKAFISTHQTAFAYINCLPAFRRLYERSGASEQTKQLLFGDESNYTM